MKKEPLLLGITGAFGSGKTTAAAFFAAHGFTKIQLSSFLEAEIRKEFHGKITRKMLQDKGNELREKFGAGILAKRALEHVAAERIERAVIDGVRNMEEVEVLCTNPNFVLLALVADREIRLKRLQENPRREALNMQTFAKLDYRDLGVGEKDTGLQTGMCIALADVYVENNGSEKELEERLKVYLEEKID